MLFVINQKGLSFLLILIAGVVILILIGGAFYFGKQSSLQNNQNTASLNETSNLVMSSTEPSVEKTIKNTVAETIISYGEKGDDTYLKMDLLSYGPKVQHISANVTDSPKNYTWVYRQDDQGLDPVEVKDFDVNSVSWKEIIKKPVEDLADVQKFLIYDRIFSFKKIPNSGDVLFVMEWSRSQSKGVASIWQPPEISRILYQYTRGNSQPKQHLRFDESPTDYSYPKIKSFNSNSSLVEIPLFSCWNCGGHMPETMLFNLKDGTSKKIGQVIEFKWTGENSYSYKDYIKIECAREGPGSCSKDPAALPLKSGTF